MKHAIGLLVILAALPAAAADLPCGPAEKGTVQLDGLTDDWNEVEGLEANAHDPNASFTVKCNVEAGRTLLLLVDVRDDYMARTRGANAAEDHLTLTFNGHPLTVLPGNARDIPTLVRWGNKPAKGIKAVSALQKAGWAVELALPLAAVPGYRQGMPIDFKAAFADCDAKTHPVVERTVDIAGNIVFGSGEGGTGAFEAFLNDRHLGRKDVWFDKNARLEGKTGARVVIANRTLAIITDSYVFTDLPAQSRSDLKDARLLDLAGDGRQAVVVRYVEHGDNAGREVLAVYRTVGEQELKRVFAAEVGASREHGKVEDKVSFVRRGKANDIIIDAGKSEGLSAANYQPTSDNIIPLLVPWGEDKHARYQFVGDEYKRAQ